MKYLMGIDLGTSSLKTILMDENGSVITVANRSYQFDSPHPGYAEQHPDVWWDACVKTIQEVLRTSRISPAEIAGISFSGQMHGAVMLDKNYQVIRPAILHCDARSDQQIEYIRSVFGLEKIRELVMNPVYTGFLLPSLLWVRDNEPELYEKIRYVFLPKDYLKFKMTGEVSSDFSDASATLAFDIKNNCWSKEILSSLQIPMDLFPFCYETTANTGKICREASEITGLSSNTIVAAGGGDQVMQGIGNGMVNVNDATVNIGSSGQVCFQIDQPVLNPALNTNMFCGYKNNRWILFGATMSAGLSLKWWNQLSRGIGYDELNDQVARIQPGSGGVIFLPYLNGERTPHVNPNLSGAFFGVNINTTNMHMNRAVMEGVAYSLMQCIEICGNLGYKAKTLVASGGGARSKPWLQLQADIYNIPLKIAKSEEQAGSGAAIAAGVGAGVFADIEEGCRKAVQFQDELVLPIEKNHKKYCEYYQLYKDIYTSCRDVLQQVTLLGRNEEELK